MTTVLPLTQAQQAMWLLHSLSTPSQQALFNVAECIEFKGKISEAMLRQAFGHLWQQADTIACQFSHDAQFKPYWQASTATPQFTVVALAADWQQVASAASQWLQPELQQPFQLAEHPLLKLTLLRGPQQDYLLLLAHHILLDGYGFASLVQALCKSYHALDSGQPLPVLALGSQQQLLLAQQQTAYLTSQAAAGITLNQWLDQTAPPCSFSSSMASVTAANLQHNAMLSSQHWGQILACCQHTNSSPAEFMLACILAVLYCHTAQPQLTLGLVMMNRQQRAELVTPCLQSNVLPFPVQLLPEQPLHPLLVQVNRQLKALKKVQHYRAESLKRDRRQQRKSVTLYGPTVNILPFDSQLAFGGVAAQSHILSAGTTDDIMLQIKLTSDQPASLEIYANAARYRMPELYRIQQHIFQVASRWSVEPALPLATFQAELAQHSQVHAQ
jgi:hypothetical protein